MYYKKRKKPKYNLHDDVSYKTGITIDRAMVDRAKKLAKLKILNIDEDGNLTIHKGYSWDGPSGPTIDTKNFMRGSLIHDALYQLMREEVIPQNMRKQADEILRDICRQDGMSNIRAWWVYQGVRLFAACAAKPDLLSAP